VPVNGTATTLNGTVQDAEPVAAAPRKRARRAASRPAGPPAQ
jgi:hypothetical protein